MDDKIIYSTEPLSSALYEHIKKLNTSAAQPRINVDQENAEKGLAQLVLTLIHFLKRLLERQAVKRMERGTLSLEEMERIGETFMKLDEKMKELLLHFNLKEEDLNLHLGPLGDLM